MSAQSQAYEVDWLDVGRGPEIAKVEFPFAIKQPMEDFSAFEARALRDFDLIMRFSVKFVVKNGVSETVATDVVKQLKLHVTKTSAWARAFLSNISKDLAEPVLAELYEQCIGNLPSVWRGGGLDPNSDEVPKQRKPKAVKQLSLLEPIGTGHYSNYKPKKRSDAKPLCAAVPNPKFFDM